MEYSIYSVSHISDNTGYCYQHALLEEKVLSTMEWEMDGKNEFCPFVNH